MMSEPVSRLAQLRTGTRDAHARIESVPALARLLASDLTCSEYVGILQHMHAFHAHLEPAIAVALDGWSAATAMLDGTRPRALAEDLAWFGAPAILPPELPLLDNAGLALGALYVVEGSALGARVIARHVMDCLGVSPGAGGSFYCRQDAETMRRRWQTFSALLETSDLDGSTDSIGPAADHNMVSGAQETFRFLESWLRTIRVAPESIRGPAEAVTP